MVDVPEYPPTVNLVKLTYPDTIERSYYEAALEACYIKAVGYTRDGNLFAAEFS